MAKKNVLSVKLVSNHNELHDGIFGDIEKFNAFIKLEFGAEELDRLYSGMQNDIRLDIAYYPRINSYKGNENMQINILHMKIIFINRNK